MSDMFLRKENFSDKRWYNEFCIFLNIGVCKPEQEDIPEVQDALLQMGFKTRVTKGYICG